MRPLLVGLNNPHSPRPRDALLPYPVGATGYRLLEMLREVDPSFAEDDYLDAFERTNVWPGMELPVGPGATAMLQAHGRRILRRIAESPREVIVLGAKAWLAVTQLEAPEFFRSRTVVGSRFLYLPHPSGRNLIYNREASRRRAGRILLSAARLERVEEVAC